jgi:hypothetical protein
MKSPEGTVSVLFAAGNGTSAEAQWADYTGDYDSISRRETAEEREEYARSQTLSLG